MKKLTLSLLSIFILSFVNLTASTNQSDKSLPKTAEELTDWIAGTEWITYSRSTSNTSCVRRFAKGKTLLLQKGTRKWKDDLHIQTGDYKINGSNSIQFGSYQWIIVFSDNFKSFKGTSGNSARTMTGKFAGRFE